MDDLNKKITEILQDPGRIQQIMEMASAMGLNVLAEEEINQQIIPQEAVQKVSRLLHQAEAKDKRQQTLVRALLPYLSPKRQARLERAMQISHLSRLAGAALQSNQIPTILTEEEEEFHV